MLLNKKSLEKYLQKITRLDILVNNAGNNRPEHFTKVKKRKYGILN